MIYPGAYVSPQQVAVGRYQILDTTEARLGESWHRGEVVLAWDHMKADADGDAPGENVVPHDFAHQLDQEDGSSNGAPLLRSSGRYAAWARVLGGEYQSLHEDLARNQMKRTHPELYGRLSDYYGLNPAQWIQ